MSTQPSPHPLIARLVEVQQRERLSQTDLASRLGLERSVCSRLLSGQVQPSIRVVSAIARAWPELRDACTAAVFDEPEPQPAAEAGV